MFRKRSILFFTFALVLLLFWGCGTSLKKGFDNFTAYYNTFYNAKQYYKRGYDEIIKQKIPINTERPIRIYRIPINVSSQNFDQAIAKSADILRYHPKSRWIDDALLLIGKSYFYEKKYFSAGKKFQELYVTSSKNLMHQRAIFWGGRVMLEMDQNNQGIDYLSRELNSPGYKWNKALRANIQLVIAELYINKKNWNNAQKFIARALPYIKDKKIKARAYFLRGQLLEMVGKYGEAFQSYSKVHQFHPEYDLVYSALKKEGEVARKSGKTKLALKIFVAMSKDDKNFDSLPELQYEIAKTLEVMKRYPEAEKTYNEVLHNRFMQPNQQTKVKSYYGLGNIYRDYYKNYSEAAAYYDSSASQVQDKSKLPQNFNAEQLAQSFGQYAKLKDQIHNLDSLMWLGSLSQSRLDSVIKIIKKKKLQELKNEEKVRQSNKNTLVNIKAAKRDQQTSNGNNGFLNYKSPRLVEEGSQAFKAIWGNRPLVDNWRRIQAIEQQNASSNQDTTSGNKANGSRKRSVQQITINLSKVPFSEPAREKMKDQIALREYEIGNVFFLSLNKPDSARHYYSKILSKYRKTHLVPQAMYSLSELYYIQNDSLKAQQWADSVITNFPTTIYALRLRNRYGNLGSVRKSVLQRQASIQDTLDQVYYSILDSLNHYSYVQWAEKMHYFGLNHSISGFAPDALFNSARQYILAAKQDTGFSTHFDRWSKVLTKWENDKAHFNQLKDTARTKLRQSKLTRSERKRWQNLADSTLKKPDFSNYFPFNGAYWDSARVVLKQLINYFPNYKHLDEAKMLYNELLPPVSSKSSKRK